MVFGAAHAAGHDEARGECPVCTIAHGADHASPAALKVATAPSRSYAEAIFHRAPAVLKPAAIYSLRSRGPPELSPVF
jgi:hypothetical protein